MAGVFTSHHYTVGDDIIEGVINEDNVVVGEDMRGGW
jgi:hypothetical protein